MIEDKTWGKVDPRDAKIMALSTKLAALEKSRLTHVKTDASANATNGGGGGAGGSNKIDNWRKKYDGDFKEVDGTPYWWCKHHKTKDYAGLYVSSHSLETHEAWAKACKEGKRGYFRPKTTPSTNAASGSSNAEKSDVAKKATLGLSDRLKHVLMTNVCLSSDDVDKLFKEAEEN